MLAGILFSLLTALLTTIGNVLEKQAVDRLPELSIRRTKHMLLTLVASGRWVAGALVSLGGLGAQMLAFSHAPIAVVQAISGAGVVLLVAISRLHLHERFAVREWVGLSVIAAAVLLVSVSASSGTAVGRAGSSSAVVLAGLASVVAVGILLLLQRPGSSRGGALYGGAAGLLYGSAALATKGASTLVIGHRLVTTVVPILRTPYPYLFVITTLLGLVVFQAGLQRFRVAVVGPMSTVVSSSYVVVVGMVIFQERLPSNPAIEVLRLVGFAGVLVGTVMLAGGVPPNEDEIIGTDRPSGSLSRAEPVGVPGEALLDLLPDEDAPR